jgi:hypothetical protein
MINRKSIIALSTFLIGSQAGAAEVVQFLGQSVPTQMNAVLTPAQITAAGIANPDDYACFQMDMRDPASGNVIGFGVDCLIFHDVPGQIVNGNGLANGKAFPNLAGDVAVEAVSIFDFGEGDVIVTSGLTSVRPLLEEFGDGGAPARTHISGSIPDPSASSVLLAEGEFSGSQGPARVSGALAINSAGLFFDCLWILDI